MIVNFGKFEKSKNENLSIKYDATKKKIVLNLQLYFIYSLNSCTTLMKAFCVINFFIIRILLHNLFNINNYLTQITTITVRMKKSLIIFI